MIMLLVRVLSMSDQYSLFNNTVSYLPDIERPVESKSKSNNKAKECHEVIEFHDPLVCERVKIQCDRCKVIYATILRNDGAYGYCGQCMGKKFTEIEGSRRVF